MSGKEFYDVVSGRQMLLTTLEGDPWLCYRHPDGQWVTLRKATENDQKRLGVVLSDTPPAPLPEGTTAADAGYTTFDDPAVVPVSESKDA